MTFCALVCHILFMPLSRYHLICRPFKSLCTWFRSWASWRLLWRIRKVFSLWVKDRSHPASPCLGEPRRQALLTLCVFVADSRGVFLAGAEHRGWRPGGPDVPQRSRGSRDICNSGNGVRDGGYSVPGGIVFRLCWYVVSAALGTTANMRYCACSRRWCVPTSVALSTPPCQPPATYR